MPFTPCSTQREAAYTRPQPYAVLARRPPRPLSGARVPCPFPLIHQGSPRYFPHTPPGVPSHTFTRKSNPQ